MATLVITDETAAAQAISTNSSRDFSVGNSSGTDRLSAGGSNVAGSGAVADSSTVDSTSLSLSTGSISIARASTATISTTVASREPTASLVSSRMAIDAGGTLLTIPQFQINALANGSFTIINNDTSASGASPTTALYQYM